MIDPDGHVFSRVGSEVAIPVLDFDGMKPENNYEMNYQLEKFDVIKVAVELSHCIGTRKIPTALKNIHRKFWGMKQLKEETVNE
jgi:hypothetical protein